MKKKSVEHQPDPIIKDRTLDESNPMFVRFVEDDRKLIVEEGDENTAFLPRYVLTPFRGPGSGLRRKES